MVKVAVAPIHPSKASTIISSLRLLFCCCCCSCDLSSFELLLQEMERPTSTHEEAGAGDEDPKQLPANDDDDDDAELRNAGSTTKLHSPPSASAEELEFDAGSTIAIAEGGEGGCPQPYRAETLPPTPTFVALDGCATASAGAGENELNLAAAAAVMSYSTVHISDGVDAPAAHGEDKKLQYTLRSNPKRSRRFLDPDYTLELAAPTSSSAFPAGVGFSVGAATLPHAAAPPLSIGVAAASPAPIKKGNSLFSEKARACTECGKQFPSWKALFGHMRCHPERQWRGIQPPTSLAAPNLHREKPSSIAIDDHHPAFAQQTIRHSTEDLTASQGPTGTRQLLSPPAPSFWHQSDSENAIKARVTRPRPRPPCSDYDVEESDTESIEAAYMNGRDQHHRRNIQSSAGARGRRTKRSLQDVVSGGGDGGHFSESNTPPDEVIEERDMADCLVMLAFAAKSKADESDGDSALLDWKNDARQSSLVSLREARKSMEAAALKLDKRSSNGRSTVQKSIPFLQEAGLEGNMLDRSWEEADHDKASWERSRSKFECSTCKKTFRSHQALGGHRASHKKVKGCFARTNAAEETTMAMLQTPDLAIVELEMNATALTMATTVADQDSPLHQKQQQKHQQLAEDEQEVFDPPAGAINPTKQKTGDQELEQQGPCGPAPPLEEMGMGQFLQFSITCSEKLEEDHNFESAEKLQYNLKHQTSSCSSSSSIIAAAAAAGTLVLHNHHHPLQQGAAQAQPKIHQCTICSRVFATGQALGGHKRCHWGGSGMPPEAGKKLCPPMRQDSDGGGGPTCMIGISTASDQRISSELSRKGRQESGSCSFASAEAPPWMNLSSSAAVTEKDQCTYMFGLSKKIRQDSVASCEEVMKAGHASVQSWLGAGYSCEKEQHLREMMDASPAACKEQSREGMITAAQRGWLEAISGNTKLGDKSHLQGTGEGRGSVEEKTLYKACEYSCSSGQLEKEGGNIPSATPSAPLMVKLVDLQADSMLDLNLPAPAEEEELAEKQTRRQVAGEGGGAGDTLPLLPAGAGDHGLPLNSTWASASEDRLTEES